MRKKASVLLFLGILAVSVVALADGTPAPLGIIPTPTPDPLSVSIWTDKSMYAIGENVTIFFSVNQAAYIYIYDIQPDGVVRLIFPNAYSQNNYVSAGSHSLPDRRYRFAVALPTGTEQLQIFACPVQLNLAPMSYGESFPMIGPDAGSVSEDIHARIMGITPEPSWATAWTSFVIVGSYGYTPPTYPTPPTYYPTPPTYSSPPSSFPHPLFPGYPGATWYWGAGVWRFGMPRSGWYWYWHNPCGYTNPCGTWRIGIRICIGCGIP